MSIFASKQVVPAKTIENFIKFALRGVHWSGLEEEFRDIMHSSRAEKLLSIGEGLDDYLLKGINARAAGIARSILLAETHLDHNKPNRFVELAEHYRRLVNNLYDTSSLLGVADSLSDPPGRPSPALKLYRLMMAAAADMKAKKLALDARAKDNSELTPSGLTEFDAQQVSVKYLKGRKWYDMEAPHACVFPEIVMRIKIEAGLPPARVERTVSSTINYRGCLPVMIEPPNPPQKPYEKITITLP